MNEAQPSAFDPREPRLPQFGEETRQHFNTWADLRKEHRALTSGGAAATAPGIIKGLISGGQLRPKCSVRIVSSSNIVCEVMASLPALPGASDEGATGISSDSDASLAGATLALKPYVCALPISMGALISSDIEAELPGILDRVFGAVVDRAVLIGDGTGNNALGVFTASPAGVSTAQDVNAGAPGAPSISDLLGMATELLGKGAVLATSACILHPITYRAMLSMDAAGMDPFKVEMLTRGTILGIPIVISAYAPSSTAACAYTCVMGDLACYGLGLAKEPAFDLISVVGSDQRTAQGYIYLNGRPLVSTAFLRLKAQ